MLQRYCEGFFNPTYLFIEKPEAHLFPSSQRIITELIALAYNARQPGMRIFLTTHSPYILTTINNLLLAGQLYQEGLSARKKGVLSQVMPAEQALQPGSVGAFYMDRKECHSIIDPDSDLIGYSAIDQVSSVLNEEFDKLSEIERS